MQLKMSSAKMAAVLSRGGGGVKQLLILMFLGFLQGRLLSLIEPLIIFMNPGQCLKLNMEDGSHCQGKHSVVTSHTSESDTRYKVCVCM